LQEYVAPVLTDLDPENCIDPEYHRLRVDKVYGWKVVRLMSRSQLDRLENVKVGGRRYLERHES
jgi:hypothetical protein